MNRKAGTIDSLIFDLDGTLWDASGTCTQAWNETLQQTGHGAFQLNQAQVRSLSGLRVEKMLQEYFTFIPADKRAEFLTCYRKNESDFMKKFGGPLYPQVKAVVTALHSRFRLFIVSNCGAGYIENFLAFHQLQDFFSDVECSGRTGQPKSNNIRLIIERNQLRNPVYIGDTHWDQEAAQAAGLPFIYAAYGFGKANAPAYRIETITDLPQLLSSLSAE